MGSAADAAASRRFADRAAHDEERQGLGPDGVVGDPFALVDQEKGLVDAGRLDRRRAVPAD